MNREVICFDAVAPVRERGLKYMVTSQLLSICWVAPVRAWIEITKGLRDKLNELRAEREGYAPNLRTDADAKAELDKVKAKAAAAEVDKDKLAASLKEREDTLKAREAELKAKNAENDKLRRELKKSTAMMRAVIDSMDEGGRHEQ